MNKFIATLSVTVLLITGCTNQKTTSSDYLTEAVQLHAVEVFATEPYRASRTREIDIIHTNLDVRFDWKNQYMYGKAIILAKPYFYTTNTMVLDAKGMEIRKVAILEGTLENELAYKYEDDVLTITLDRNYAKSETFKVFIEYVSKPEERETNAGNAVTDDKGLYFINPLGEDPKKPQQIWTQGETEANSVWFPTIDSPNERCTHEISITVEDRFVTLSNGLLSSSEKNDDGTRTDTWVQAKPIAPYLFMMAISEFAVVEDVHNGMKMNYYVDKDYEPYAKEIFKNTGEMISFYSEVLGYDYPWSKYSQVIVHDYVSGAMENVGAVIFGDFVQQTHREMIDGDNEETVAHELFHHWFGDLVTCESWSNLPLNESFATYGEYLWFEHKYGRMRADEHLDYDLQGYLYEVKSSGAEDLIRFQYNKPDDMFDSHSYAKGGRVLHMLRNYVGDDAFFEGLKLYLHDNEYTSVEIHQLRLAFEKVTGEDLNWFFNQWFMGKGHPDLNITYTWDADSAVQYVTVEQLQNVEEYALFKLPVKIDMYVNGAVQSYKVVVDSVKQTFAFKSDSKPDFVNFDADKMLICTKKENHTLNEMAAMYRQAPLYMDKLEAMKFAYTDTTNEKLAKEILLDAMLDEYDGIRREAVSYYDKFDEINDLKLKDVLVSTMKNDPESMVRNEAVIALYDYFAWAEGMTENFIAQIVVDSSYEVIGGLLRGIAISDSTLGLEQAVKFEGSKSKTVLFSVAEIYSVFGTAKNNDFFIQTYPKAEGYYIMSFIDYYKDFLLRIDDLTIQESAVNLFEKEASNPLGWFVRYYAVSALSDLRTVYESREKSATKANEVSKAEGYGRLVKRIDDFLANLRLTEKDGRVFMQR